MPLAARDRRWDQVVRKRRHHFTRTDCGTLGTAHTLPPLPIETVCAQKRRIASLPGVLDCTSRLSFRTNRGRFVRLNSYIPLNAQPGEWNDDSADSIRFPLSHPSGTRTTVALPVVVMRPLTVRSDQRIGIASSFNFPFKAMGLRARGQNAAVRW